MPVTEKAYLDIPRDSHTNLHADFIAVCPLRHTGNESRSSTHSSVDSLRGRRHNFGCVLDGMIYCIALLLLWSLAFGEIVPSFLGERTFFLEGDLLLLTSLDVTQNRNSKGQRERHHYY